MEAKRMTGDDYLKKLNTLDEAQVSLKAHTKSRLKDLIKRHPEAIVVNKPLNKFQCKDITQAWLDGLSTLTTIHYIQNIESWLIGKQVFRQMTIDETYNEIPDELKSLS